MNGWQLSVCNPQAPTSQARDVNAESPRLKTESEGGELKTHSRELAFLRQLDVLCPNCLGLFRA